MHPRIRQALLAVGGIVLATALAITLTTSSGGSTERGFEGAVRADGIPVADFALRDQDGTLIRSRDTRGSVAVVTFLYTTCRDTCPIMASTIGQALDRLGHDVPVLAVSVDPANDTPELARRFLRLRRLDGRIHFLLGSREQLDPVWKAYYVRPQSDGLEHSAYVILLDRDGRQRISFPADRLTPEGLAHDIRALEDERPAT